MLIPSVISDRFLLWEIPLYLFVVNKHFIGMLLKFLNNLFLTKLYYLYQYGFIDSGFHSFACLFWPYTCQTSTV